MSLQFVDFNADGHKDIVAATWEGTVFLVAGSDSGWKQPEYIRDNQDRLIYLSRYYDMKRHKYDNAERSPAGVKNPKDHLISAMVWDWDNDGDYDLLLGAKEGRLYLQKNEGKPGKPGFVGTNTLLEAGGKEFNVPGGMTAARKVDWDKDGLADLVCGSFEGGAYLYRNTGKLGAPSFAAPVQLLKSAKSPDGKSGPETGWYVDPVDYDGDGDLDLLVGGHFMLQPKKRKLTEAEEKRLEAVDAELKELMPKMMEISKKFQESIKDASDEERQKAMKEFQANEELQALSKKYSALHREQMTLRGQAQRTSGVWLYRRHQIVASKDKPAEKGN